MNLKLSIVLVLSAIYTNTFSQTGWQQVTNFGANPGNLNMYVYIPEAMPANAPVVVALHGCTQTATSFSTSSGWSEMADRYKFYLVYPEQNYLNNSSYCFNWFLDPDFARTGGEAESVNRMVEYIKAHYSVANNKVFVTGLSAGAGLTAAMLAVYPDVFKAGAIMSGCPYKSATDAYTAYLAMSGMVTKTPAEWKALVTGAYPGYTGAYPAVSIFHGLNDMTVNPSNIAEMVKQWTAVNNSDAAADVLTPSFNSNADIEQAIYCNSAGDTVVLTYKFNNMGHAISVDPGTCPFQGGAAQLYSVDMNFHSTWWAARFFSIIPLLHIAGDTAVTINQAGLVYSVQNTSGSTYNWTVPTGAIITSGQGTNQITVDWGTSEGDISVVETDANACVFPPEKLHVHLATSNGGAVEKIYSVQISPSPFVNTFKLQINDYRTGSVFVKLYSTSGKILLQAEYFTGREYPIGDDLQPGVYFLEIKTVKFSRMYKVIKIS